METDFTNRARNENLDDEEEDEGSQTNFLENSYQNKKLDNSNEYNTMKV